MPVDAEERFLRARILALTKAVEQALREIEALDDEMRPALGRVWRVLGDARRAEFAHEDAEVRDA